MCIGARRGSTVVEYITTYAIDEYRHRNCEFESLFKRSVLDKYYLIMFDSYLRHVNGFLLFSLPIKLIATI
jgi:hypothetical protein